MTTLVINAPDYSRPLSESWYPEEIVNHITDRDLNCDERAALHEAGRTGWDGLYSFALKYPHRLKIVFPKRDARALLFSIVNDYTDYTTCREDLILLQLLETLKEDA